MTHVWITEARAVTAAGTLEASWRALLGQRTAIGKVSRFSTDGYTSSVAACIEDLSPTGRSSRIHDLLDRLLHDPLSIPSGSYLITATTKCGIDNLERLYGGKRVDEDDILPASLPAIVGGKLGVEAPGFNVSSACASSTIALARAASMIRSGTAQSVVVCCLDLVTEFVFSGFSSLRILSPSPCRPFDRKRDGLSLGEGAALLLLTSEQLARQKALPCKGVIAGWGIANDAEHIVTPASDGRGLVRAIRLALERASLKPGDIAAVGAHGTGTVHNDATELTAFETAFKKRPLPIYSVKGALGHTLGAAGGIEVAIALRALAEQLGPPTVGFSEREEGVAANITREPTPLEAAPILTTNSGFGGVSCALVLESGHE